MRQNALLFFILFFSFQASCMTTDALVVIMKKMDYKSNIQFIRTCQTFHKFFAEKNDVLFTNHCLHPTDYMNAMIHFARRNDTKKVDLLMQHEGRVNRNNREDIAIYFHANKATIYEDAVDMYSRKYDKESFLDVRTLIKELPVLALVLKQGYQNFNYCDEKGDTPLHNAVDFGDIDACKTLLSLGDLVDPNVQNEKGNTPLHFATIPCFVMPHKYKMVKLLLDDTRVNPNIKNNDGYAPLHIVVDLFSHVNNQGLDTLTWLLTDSRVDPNIQTNEGDTLLHIMANCLYVSNVDNRIKTLNYVLSHPRVNPNLQNNRGNTPLYSSVILSNFEVLNCLLADSRFDCNSKDKHSNTVYDLAYNPDIRQFLAPRVSFVNRHKQTIMALVYVAPLMILVGASMGIVISEGFFPGCTVKGFHKVANMLGY